jgi:tetratricopeptide (TPR) repeat protein
MKPSDLLLVAQDLCMHGIALSAQGQREESLAVYVQVIETYGERRKLEFLNVLATAMFNMGTTLAALGRDEEAVTAYDKLIKKFDKSKQAKFDIYLVKALMNKAYRLNTLLRNDDAIAAYQDVITRFGGTKDAQMLPLVDSVKVFLAERKAVLAARAAAAKTTA